MKTSTAPIQPSEEHPGYWSYRGTTTLLVGGSREDNLFQIDDLVPHLDALAAAGGNYIRNTMSDRDEGNVYAFHRYPDGPNAGKYELDRWNPKYWDRFTRLLDACVDRDIIVQIEVWDRFDVSGEPWLSHPWNPVNNVTYDSASTGLAPEYPEHPSRNLQPFFHTVPAMDGNALLLEYQKRFVDKVLSISLAYPNVLYCMNNETHEDPAWGRFWLEHVRARAREANTDVVATDMFDGPWESGIPQAVVDQFADPDMYQFIDVSQVNAWRCTTERHWKNLERLNELNRSRRRPLTCTKVYNSDTLHDQSAPRHTDRDGITAFWLDLLGGCASARFHRPPHGLGLSPKAASSIRTVRTVEDLVRFWELTPHFDWTGGRPPAEAFLAEAFLAEARGVALVLLPGGGAFHPQSALPEGRYEMKVIDLTSGDVETSTVIDLTQDTTLDVPAGDPKLAVLRALEST